MKIVKTHEWYKQKWGDTEEKVIEAMKVMAEYCDNLRTHAPCNDCPMFQTCVQIGSKEWIIPDFRENKE